MTQVNMEKLQQSIIRLHKLEAQIEDVAANKETKSEQAKPEKWVEQMMPNGGVEPLSYEFENNI